MLSAFLCFIISHFKLIVSIHQYFINFFLNILHIISQRFGCALLMTGQINLKKKKYATDMDPIDKECVCNTCKNYTKAYLHGIVNDLPVACLLITEHNLAFQLRLMKDVRENILKGTFVQFVQNFMLGIHPDKNYPSWIRDSLQAVNISLL